MSYPPPDTIPYESAFHLSHVFLEQYLIVTLARTSAFRVLVQSNHLLVQF